MKVLLIPRICHGDLGAEPGHLHMEPETTGDLLVLQRLVDEYNLMGHGCDVHTWHVAHVQVPITELPKHGQDLLD